MAFFKFIKLYVVLLTCYLLSQRTAKQIGLLDVHPDTVRFFYRVKHVIINNEDILEKILFIFGNLFTLQSLVGVMGSRNFISLLHQVWTIRFYGLFFANDQSTKTSGLFICEMLICYGFPVCRFTKNCRNTITLEKTICLNWLMWYVE